METDFAQWYTDVVRKAGLVDYLSLKGFVVVRPYAYAIWENIQRTFDAMIKSCGHENVYMPLLIPESLLQKEKDLVEGFAPEVAWVTHGGSEELTERLCVRPTSETVFCEHYANIIQSWRDLPKLYNQWCSVVRWEKTTRPFLRGREFLWQEGHTVHATREEAEKETYAILDMYAKLCEETLAMPVIKGRKTESEKFPGAEFTLGIECMMHDGKALQSGTSHYFGTRFAEAFNIQFTSKNNKLETPFQTSWGISTRLIGGIIMTHGDNNGLVLPPRVAPTQVIVIPVAAHKPGVLDAAEALKNRLLEAGIRAGWDASSESPGWKFAEYEMKGVPLRIELGPRDIEAGTCMAARRDTGEKRALPLENAAESVRELLDEIQNGLLESARRNMSGHTGDAQDLVSMKTLAEKGGFIRAMWCGDPVCEERVKEETGMKSRCVPFEQHKVGECCVACGKPAGEMVYFGFQY